jgi:predicted dehydrogenase
MAEQVRVAIIGCGGIARLHVQRLLADGRAAVVAVCDPAAANTERLRAELAPAAQVFDHHQRLLDAVACDAAVICTPTLFHHEQVVACLDRGLDVLCEKPLADTRERIVDLIERTSSAARQLATPAGSATTPPRRRPILMVAYQRRFDTTFRSLRREVRSGRWGHVKSVTTHNCERWQQGIAGTWRDDPRLNPAGFIGDAGSHKIDMLAFVTGLAPVELFALGDRRGSRVEIVTTIMGRLANGAALSMNFIGDAQHWREDFQVHCEAADLVIRDGVAWIGRDNRFEQLDQIAPLELGSDPDAALVDLMLAGRVNAAPPTVALPVFDFTAAVFESARARLPVTLPAPAAPLD